MPLEPCEPCAPVDPPVCATAKDLLDVASLQASALAYFKEHNINPEQPPVAASPLPADAHGHASSAEVADDESEPDAVGPQVATVESFAIGVYQYVRVTANDTDGTNYIFEGRAGGVTLGGCLLRDSPTISNANGLSLRRRRTSFS
jgi:hypothetical protein